MSLGGAKNRQNVSILSSFTEHRECVPKNVKFVKSYNSAHFAYLTMKIGVVCHFSKNGFILLKYLFLN
ncbi:hypothetical protein EGR_03542 [Echinococcus granulosus]|uniref:Uncharacterized protein n=1 Tax=Echinococcus granulosus TaxID=6210 RepID=W6UK91_ECHGR|nr:hypothetical protein EGR_03542 [Echinococcus granulosus]EUB61478.1 hypothetical protein EGR_03542 [Echinococcus granulosus]